MWPVSGLLGLGLRRRLPPECKQQGRQGTAQTYPARPLAALADQQAGDGQRSNARYWCATVTEDGFTTAAEVPRLLQWLQGQQGFLAQLLTVQLQAHLDQGLAQLMARGIGRQFRQAHGSRRSRSRASSARVALNGGRGLHSRRRRRQTQTSKARL